MIIRVNGDNVITAIVYNGNIPDGIDVPSIPEGVDVLTHKYADGKFMINPDYKPPQPAPEDTLMQDDYNMDFDYRLSCLELGL